MDAQGAKTHMLWARGRHKGEGGRWKVEEVEEEKADRRSGGREESRGGRRM